MKYEKYEIRSFRNMITDYIVDDDIEAAAADYWLD